MNAQQVSIESQKFTPGEIIIEIWIFRQKADFLARPWLEGVFAKNCNAAGVRENQIQNALDGGRFAGTIWPEIAKNLAFIDIKRDAL